MELSEELIEQHHQELLESIKELVESIPKIDNSDIVKAIEDQAKKVQGFTAAVKAIKFPTPQVNVSQPDINISQPQIEIDTTELIKIGNSIISGQEKILTELTRLREWRLDFQRTEEGIQSPIKAIQIK